MYGRRAGRPLLTFIAGALIIVVPWVVRNDVQLGTPVVGTTGSGFVAYQGHNPRADGGPSAAVAAEVVTPFAALPRTQREVQTNALASRLAREWATHHLVQEVRLVPRRLAHLYSSDSGGVDWIQVDRPAFSASGARRLTTLSDIAFFGLVALSVLGLPVWARRRDPRVWLVVAIVPFYTLIFGLLLIGDPRYHYIEYLPLAILAGASLATPLAAVREHVARLVDATIAQRSAA